MLSLVIAMSAVSADDIRPEKFYVAGVSQNMSLSEYNSLISNGGFKSEPIGPNRFRAIIDKQIVYVSFCNDRVVQTISEYSSSEWLQSIIALERVGFKWGNVSAYVEENRLRTGYLTVSVTSPRSFTYFASPLVKAATLDGRDFSAFQIVFEANENSCR
jgi:hypothetical protein